MSINSPDPLLSAFEQFVQHSIASPGQKRQIANAGIVSNYLEWPGPKGAPTLLLLHGFLAHAHWWDFIAPWLASRFRVIALDFGGMGDSGTRPEYAHEQFEQEIEGLVTALGIRGCIGVGHSFGGRTLLYTCGRFPDLFSRAIVVDSRLGSPDDPLRGFDDIWRPKKRYDNEATILQRFLLVPEEPAPAIALAHMGRHSIRQEADGQWVWKFDEIITRLFRADPNSRGVDDNAELRNMMLPVDFIYGEDSRVVTPARAARLKACLPNVRSVTGLPASYHHLPVSQPIALLGVLRALLQ